MDDSMKVLVVAALAGIALYYYNQAYNNPIQKLYAPSGGYQTSEMLYRINQDPAAFDSSNAWVPDQ